MPPPPQESVHFSEASHNVSLSALSIKDPDCHGWVYKQGNGIKSWKRRYCVLKSHQLFYYGKMSHTTAYGVMNLRGYQILCGKSKDKKYYFNAVSPDKGMREFHFYTETEGDRERWVTCFGEILSGLSLTPSLGSLIVYHYQWRACLHGCHLTPGGCRQCRNLYPWQGQGQRSEHLSSLHFFLPLPSCSINKQSFVPSVS